ncbi:hypothetical protein [Oceanospirillum sediminis]|nr:hypothetical protein [Oceanospirillum sediminis]
MASKGFPVELIPVFQSALEEIRSDGTYSRLYNSYFQLSGHDKN